MAPGIDYSALAAVQLADDEMLAYQTAISGLVFDDMSLGPAGITVLCDVSTGYIVFDVIFNVIHGLANGRRWRWLLHGSCSMGCESKSAVGPRRVFRAKH